MSTSQPAEHEEDMWGKGKKVQNMVSESSTGLAQILMSTLL